MSRNQLNKEELKCYILKLMQSVYYDRHVQDPKSYARSYLQHVLDKLEEYRY